MIDLFFFPGDSLLYFYLLNKTSLFVVHTFEINRYKHRVIIYGGDGGERGRSEAGGHSHRKLDRQN